MRALASIPNLLTIARLLLAPFIFAAIVNGRHALALALFACASLTDGLDGLLARRFGQITPVGAYLDPIADKVLFTGYRQFRPSVWGKASTFAQIACAIAWMTQNAVDSPGIHALAEALIWPTAAITVWSGLHYSWRGFRFVRAH